MKAADICRRRARRRRAVEAPETPSSELPMHLAIYAATRRGRGRPHAFARGHRAVRQPDELPAIHYAITALGGPVRVAGYTRFGSAGLAAAAARRWTGRRAAILQNHGAICYGATLTQAYERALLLEWLARVYRLASLRRAADSVAGRARRGVRRGPAAPLRRARRPREPAAHDGRRTGRAMALGRWSCSGAHRGRARTAGRGHPAGPGQRAAGRDQGDRRGHGRGHRGGPGETWRPGARRSAPSAATCWPTSWWRALARHGVDTSGLVRKAGRADLGDHPADPAQRRAAGPARARRDAAAGAGRHRPGRGSAAADALLLGGPDALAALSAADLAAIVAAAKAAARWSLIDVLHPGSPRDFDRLSGALAIADWFCPNADQFWR